MAIKIACEGLIAVFGTALVPRQQSPELGRAFGPATVEWTLCEHHRCVRQAWVDRRPKDTVSTGWMFVKPTMDGTPGKLEALP